MRRLVRRVPSVGDSNPAPILDRPSVVERKEALKRTHIAGWPIAAAIAIVAIALLKLWLAGGLENYAAPWDPQEYLRIAKTWYWGDRANYYRPPGFALFIAAVHAFGVPLRMALESVLIFAAYRAAASLRIWDSPGGWAWGRSLSP